MERFSSSAKPAELLPTSFNFEQDNTLRIIRSLSIFLCLVACLLTLVYLFSGYYPKFLLASAISFVFTIPLILIRQRKFETVKVYFFFQLIFVSVLIPLAVGEDARTEWVIVMAPLLSALLFGHERHLLSLSLGMLGYLSVLSIYHFHEPWLVPTYPQIYRFVLAMSISVFLYWLVILFKKETLRSDQIIVQQNQQLLEQQEILAQQNGELLVANQLLDQQRASLQALNEELRQFTHVASHDMKEPLRNISSFATLLSRRIDNPDHREYLAFIESGAKRMSRMLEDLIAYARVGVENSPRERVSLNDLLLSTQMSLRSQLQQTAGSIEAATPLPVLLAHGTLLAQLFQNLIGNSLKYRREGVPPVVKIHFLKEIANRPNVCQLHFEDNGIGIAPEHLTSIFEPFRRLHGQSEIEGSGIGLATCRKIADLYGGRIWAESVVGNGTRVILELPKEMMLLP